MRILTLAAFAGFALAGCTTVVTSTACGEAARLIPTDASGDEIVAAAEACLAQGGTPAHALVIRSAGHLRAERYDRAVADADAAIEADPIYADAWYYRGFAHEERGDVEAAGRDFDKAIELGLSPNYAFRARGRLKFLNNDFAGAWDDFDALVKADAGDQEAWRLRGATAAVLERYGAAEADFTHAIALDPGDLKAYSGRAYVRYFTGRYDDATADFKTALSGKPEGLKAAFLYLAMRRANDPLARAELERQAASLDAARNPGVFPAFFLGRVSLADMVRISMETGIHKPAENESEGYFYAGMGELFAGRKAEAKSWFEKTLATGVIRFDEIRGARKELRAMGVRVPSPDPRAAGF